MKKRITQNTLRNLGLLLTCSILVQCQINYLTKPKIKKIEKLENRSSSNNYNFYQFFGNAFESELGEKPGSAIHVKFNYHDSTFRISIDDFDSDKPDTYTYFGKYEVNERGLIQLLAVSPFKNAQLQVVMIHGVREQLVQFEFNELFKKIFPGNLQIAYCEGEEFNLEDCIIR